MQEAVLLKALRLVPVNNDLAAAQVSDWRKSFSYALMFVVFGVCLRVPLFAFALCGFFSKS